MDSNLGVDRKLGLVVINRISVVCFLLLFVVRLPDAYIYYRDRNSVHEVVKSAYALASIIEVNIRNGCSVNGRDFSGFDSNLFNFQVNPANGEITIKLLFDFAEKGRSFSLVPVNRDASDQQLKLSAYKGSDCSRLNIKWLCGAGDTTSSSSVNKGIFKNRADGVSSIYMPVQCR